MLLLLTGARCREITLAKWEHIDWTKRVLLVSVSKSGKPRTIALNAAALALLRSIPRDPTCPHVFPTRLVGQRYAHLAPQTLLDAAELVSSVIGTNQITAVSEATRAPPGV